MTLISRVLRLAGVAAALVIYSSSPDGQAQAAAPSESAFADDLVDVDGLVLTGLERTSARWLEGYIDYAYPARLSRRDADGLARRLMTTGVFTDVKVTLDPADAQVGRYTLHVHVEEKWTTIPVIRGVYGGGTPLRILGAYDTHSFGRLLTLGGELRKYGDAPPGFVLYARDPRSQAGRYYLGAEFWRDLRRRQLYARDGREIGAASTNAAIARIRVLTPLAFGGTDARDYRWKYGVDVEAIQDAPSVFDPAPGALETPPPDLRFADEGRRQYRLLPTLVYDDIDVGIVENDGVRLKVKAGPTRAEDVMHGSMEVEAFAYEMLPRGVNLAAHGLIGRTSYDSLQSQYFLGGFDSIRGLPDGALYGTHAAYANAEVRHLSFKARYLWIQSVAFADAGGAGPDFNVAWDDRRSAAGLGVRFAVPQIYRMIFRFDYAWAFGDRRSKGLTAGMSQFFDPYTPL